MGYSRRDFLKFLYGGSALALGGGSFFKNLAFPHSDQDIIPQGVESWVPSVCQLCPGGCGVLARVIDEKRVVKLEGNPLHPVNRGSLCPKGYAGLQVLYSEFRIRTPLKRAGEKGSHRWENIGWEEALEIVSSNLRELREKEKPHTLALISGQCRGITRHLLKGFLNAYGSPNFIEDSFYQEYSPVPGIYLLQGAELPLVYDLENANYILSFGAPWLESFWSPVQAFRAYGTLKAEKRKPRGRVIQVEPRLSVTGARANQWVPINPETEGVLALGIAYMLIKENLYNQDFVSRRTFGFENWRDEKGIEHQGFKEFVLGNYHLSEVSQITGVQIESIIQLAREFARFQPAIALGEDSFNLNHQDTFTRMAIHSLNGLVGNLEITGGVLLPQEVPLSKFSQFDLDGVTSRGNKMPRIDHPGEDKYPLAKNLPDLIPDNIIQEKPYPISTLFVYNTDPVFSSPVSEKFVQALNKIPLVVSFSSFMDETAEYADLILPDHTYLERLEDDPTNTLQGFPVLGLRQPVIKPLYQTKSTGEVILELARRSGEKISTVFPWKDYKEALDFSLRGVYQSGRGDLFGEPFEEIWTRVLEKRGWKAPAYRSFEEFLQGLRDKGGWWDPLYKFGDWERVLKTPSRKFEFYSQILKNKLKEESSKEDNNYLPHPSLAESKEEQSLHLRVFPLHYLSEDKILFSPWLKDNAGYYLKEKWHPWVEINPEKAKELGIKDKDWVWVESSRGKLKLKARIYAGIMPEVVGVPFGFEDQGEGKEYNPIILLEDNKDPLTGRINWGETKVKIYKA